MSASAELNGRYELHEVCGRGGMAHVYRATDRRLGRTVAVKVLAPELLADARAVAHFRDEARTAARLKHPNIVSVHDADQHDGSWFIVMEFVGGPTLTDVIARNTRLRVATTVGVATGIADALTFAHAAGVVHRDVKPGNVLFDADGTIKVADFGIARATSADATIVRGSPYYLAPEQARGRAADPRSDIYALGCVVFEMLTGRPPFTEGTPTDIIRAHVLTPSPSVRDRRSDVPQALEMTVARMLAKDPDERHTSMDQVRAELADAAPTRSVGGSGDASTGPSRGDAPTRAVPTANASTQVLRSAETMALEEPGAAPRARHETARRRITIGAGAGAGVAAVVVAVLLGFVFSRPPAQSAAAEAPSAPPAPTLVQVTVTAEPEGLDVAVDNERDLGPLSTDAETGTTLRLRAPSPQTIDGVTYEFGSWSDGGDRSHTIDVPERPLTLTARFDVAEPELEPLDIGAPQVAGATTVSDGEYEITGGGADIWDERDQFHFVSRPLDDDTAITARVTSQTESDPYAKSGIMIRDGRGADARNVLLAIRPSGNVTMQFRGETSGPTEERDGGPAAPPQWLRLVRTGDEVTGLASDDGETWRRIASTTLPLGPDARVGLAVTGHDPDAASTATFTDVEIGAADDVEPLRTTECPDGMWAAEYYAGIELSGTPVAWACEDRIAFDWGLGGPVGDVPADGFSVRWEQTTDFEPGTYTFTGTSDDGVRVWVDGEPVIDNWSDHEAQTVTGSLDLDGVHTVRVEYYDNLGFASIRLDW